uniref:Uncharacterized protein n=1 Tax=Leersia perrieri TaxID=77586 RepID=A0A0D9XRK0_9ORYZ
MAAGDTGRLDLAASPPVTADPAARWQARQRHHPASTSMALPASQASHTGRSTQSRPRGRATAGAGAQPRRERQAEGSRRRAASQGAGRAPTYPWSAWSAKGADS